MGFVDMPKGRTSRLKKKAEYTPSKQIFIKPKQVFPFSSKGGLQTDISSLGFVDQYFL